MEIVSIADGTSLLPLEGNIIPVASQENKRRDDALFVHMYRFPHVIRINCMCRAGRFHMLAIHAVRALYIDFYINTLLLQHPG